MHPRQLLEEFAQDLRFTARQLLRSPAFTLAAIASLAIGIGVTTVLFTNLQSTIFRSLPGVPNTERLVRIQRPLPYENLRHFQQSGPFASLAGFVGPVPFLISEGNSKPERIWGHIATPGYFEVLGVRPLAGSFFPPSDQTTAAPSIAVISETLANTRFQSPQQAVGRTIRLNGQPVTIIGVTPPKFAGASPFLASAGIWIPSNAPLALAPELRTLQTRTPVLEIFGRLRPAQSFRQAEAALEPITRELERLHADPNRESQTPRIRLLPGGRLFPLPDEDLPGALGLPIVLASLVLFMACGNVANMLIARGMSRRREIAVRLSIGASRARLIRQMLAESTLLAALGGLAGLLLASQIMSFYESLRPMLPSHIYFDFSVDWRALAIAALASGLSALAVGLLPALQSTSHDVSGALKSSGSPRLGPWRWLNLRNIVVTNQVAASMLLLLLTGFIVLGFGRSTNFDLGFDTRNLHLVNIDPVRDGFSPAEAAQTVDRLAQRFQRLSGVESVSIAQTLPLAFSSGETITDAKVDLAGGAQALTAIRGDRVGADFFAATRIPLLHGRGISRRDVDSSAPVLVVNETLAQRNWPGQNPIGFQLDFEGKRHEVIGVARDIRPGMPLGAGQPSVYLPLLPAAYATPSRYGLTLLVRTAPGVDAQQLLKTELANFDHRLTPLGIRRMHDIARESLFFAQLAVNVYGSMGVFAMILACTGLAGVTAYAVARRRREIGIRLALGSSQAAVYRLVMKESALMILIGGATGLLLAIAVMRALASLLNTLAEATRTSASDPMLILGAPLLLASIALLVCFVPARQTLRIDPTVALREEG